MMETQINREHLAREIFIKCQQLLNISVNTDKPVFAEEIPVFARSYFPKIRPWLRQRDRQFRQDLIDDALQNGLRRLFSPTNPYDLTDAAAATKLGKLICIGYLCRIVEKEIKRLKIMPPFAPTNGQDNQPSYKNPKEEPSVFISPEEFTETDAAARYMKIWVKFFMALHWEAHIEKDCAPSSKDVAIRKAQSRAGEKLRFAEWFVIKAWIGVTDDFKDDIRNLNVALSKLSHEEGITRDLSLLASGLLPAWEDVPDKRLQDATSRFCDVMLPDMINGKRVQKAASIMRECNKDHKLQARFVQKAEVLMADEQ